MAVRWVRRLSRQRSKLRFMRLRISAQFGAWLIWQAAYLRRLLDRMVSPAGRFTDTVVRM
jgi:uncharacterized RDD family membrane protein YckC